MVRAQTEHVTCWKREDGSCIIYEELPRTDIGGSRFDSGASIGSHL